MTLSPEICFRKLHLSTTKPFKGIARNLTMLVQSIFKVDALFRSLDLPFALSLCETSVRESRVTFAKEEKNFLPRS